MLFSDKILLWYSLNKRDLPWRNSLDPYKIWLSEIMLQQTKVAQGLPYYHKFVAAFPTVFDLADAEEEKVLKLWQGLGYYSRARNLHITAKNIAYNCSGLFPETYKELVKLKGVGDYTASAIASFCFNKPEPVVDGNVYRVLSRYFGVDLPINSSKGIKYFKELAIEVMNEKNIKDYNQGIMEFGALQCAPKKPDCLSCPLNDGCVALTHNKIAQLPIKLRKTKVKNRYFNYIIPLFVDADGFYRTQLNKRLGKGIWQNLFEFPVLETENEVELEEVRPQALTILGVANLEEMYSFYDKTIVHKLSHQHLYVKFWVVKTEEKLEKGILMDKVNDYPVPVLIANFLETFKI